MAFASPALVLEHGAAFLTLFFSLHHQNEAPTHSAFLGLSDSQDKAQGCLWHPAQPQASCQWRGEACMPSAACLRPTHTAGKPCMPLLCAVLAS